MSYQVLARKWRPKNFSEMVGQEHVLRMLTNALENQRLHHAYLFTGTRGVGKTTLGRIIAKCLNCEEKITSTPCGTCSACQAIDAGRFFDLMEIDAASRTKVEDTRELLENVQYAPNQGRFKIYLIDEVHMLSGHSFNALLKTLEEPPAHVKFLLATTDPKKLPITILSRCLQFHLKRLPVEQISHQLEHICKLENMEFEPDGLLALGHAADGSMRDALSLLDQAIAYCNGKLAADEIRNMLGQVEQEHIYHLLDALAEQDGKKLLSAIASLNEQAPDYNNVLENILEIFHNIAIQQTILDIANDKPEIAKFAKQFSAEDTQLYYQIALTGRRDLPLAVNPAQGFEMLMLRMLAFHPVKTQIVANTNIPAAKQTKTPEKLEITEKPAEKIKEVVAEKISQPVSSDWSVIIDKLNLTGMSQIIVTNSILENISENQITLSLSNKHAAILNKKLTDRLEEALSEYFQKKMSLQINLSSEDLNTTAKQQENAKKERHANAVDAISKDQHVKKIMDVFGATLDPNSIKAVEQ